MSDFDCNCPFCNQDDAVLNDGLAHARYDKNPVTPGHMLIIPNRHVDNYFQMSCSEKLAVMGVMEMAHALLEREFTPAGYNFGVNVGVVAGQTVMHVHLHLIPRYEGDVEHPRGGVRGVIPARQSY